jgi:hypothetical protein
MADPKPGPGGDTRPGSRPDVTRNDDRGVVKNPTSREYAADEANRDRQKRAGG